LNAPYALFNDILITLKKKNNKQINKKKKEKKRKEKKKHVPVIRIRLKVC
jgi:hypothetical protein